MESESRSPGPDRVWMQRALAEAERGRGSVEPNPMVGAVLVRDQRLLAVGHHGRFSGPHAEVVALEAAGDEARGARLFVTLEPCCHHGKTPPCTEAILRAGVIEVITALRDPFPRVAGGGLKQLRDAGLTVQVGLMAEEAIRQNEAYLKRLLTGRPYVTAKWAMTLDGKTATGSGASAWISGLASRARVHEERGRNDAIVIGIGTALQDDPQLTARPPGPRTPIRIVVDRWARLPVDSRLVRSIGQAPVWVATTSKADRQRCQELTTRGVEILEVAEGEDIPPGRLLDMLGERGLTRIVLEGGGTLAGRFLDDGQVDAVDVFVAPLLEGGDHARTAFRGHGVEAMDQALRLVEPPTITQIDADVRIQGRLPQPWRERAARAVQDDSR